jgi:hypothetical protein
MAGPRRPGAARHVRLSTAEAGLGRAETRLSAARAPERGYEGLRPAECVAHGTYG